MRNFVFAAAMAAMVCVIGCDKVAVVDPHGPKGEKGDKGDPGVGAVEIGKDCQTDEDCDEVGKCTSGKFCAWTSGDDIVASVRKRREQELVTAQATHDRREKDFLDAEKQCADSSAAECKPADEAKRRLEAAERTFKQAKDALALVTPAEAPPKADVAKADDKTGKKDEKPADAKKPSDKKPASPEATAKADAVEDLKVKVGLLDGKVGDIEGRTDGLEDNQKTLFGKTGELVIAAAALGKKIEAKPPAGRIEPSDTRIFNYRRFNSCVKSREIDAFVGEGITAEERKTKIENDCKAKQAG